MPEVYNKRCVILDIHPQDYFYEFREEMIGRVIEVSYGHPSREVDSEYTYCFAKFVQPLWTERIIIQEIVFLAVKLGELEDVEYSAEAETDQDYKS